MQTNAVAVELEQNFKYLLGFYFFTYFTKPRNINMILRKASKRYNTFTLYRGADKSLTRPGRKQATATKGFEFYISYL